MTRRVIPSTAGNRGLDERLAIALAAERAAALERRCPPLSGRSGVRYRLDGREVVSFCSNDYLGLADERPPVDAAASGAAASRLVCGDLEDHRAIEREFASFIGLDDAVLLPSGFQANVGVPAALLDPRDVVFSDALNHASLIDGLRLSSATRRILDHLERPPIDAGEGLRWWFVESVFSMDGDGPALADLESHLVAGGCLYLDEAHALGLFAGGRGRAAQLRHRPTVLVAPLGKAFGCAGAFVCGSKQVCEWIRGHARGFVFSTAVAPVVVARIRHALELISGPQGDRRREALWRNVERLRAGLGRAGFGQAGLGPIVPITVGANAAAVELSAALLERGWHVQAIRPPTVPEGAARLRITVSAAHEPEQLDAFVDDLVELLAVSGVGGVEP